MSVTLDFESLTPLIPVNDQTTEQQKNLLIQIIENNIKEIAEVLWGVKTQGVVKILMKNENNEYYTLEGTFQKPTREFLTDIEETMEENSGESILFQYLLQSALSTQADSKTTVYNIVTFPTT